jgi:hypothetical protein
MGAGKCGGPLEANTVYRINPNAHEVAAVR